MSSLDLALRLVARGWHVLPVDAKIPIGGLVPRGHLDATDDPETIRAWWTARPDARPAIALEQSGLVALDMEGPKKTPDGIPSLRSIAGELTETAAQATPSGGAHLIYRRMDECQTRRIIRWMPGIDLLGKGYVVAYDEVAGEPAPLPDVLARAFVGKPSEKRSETVDTEFEPASWELLAYAHRLAMAHGGKAKGEGGNQHAYALGAILRHDLALSEDEARPIILAWRDAFPETQGWREEYLLETVEHATRYATTLRGARRGELAVLAVAGVKPGDLEWKPPEGGPGGPFAGPAAADWYDRASAVELIRARADEPWIEVGVAGVRVDEVRAGGTVTLQGPTGAGKTSLVAEMILHHCRAGGWALGLSAELSADEFCARAIGIVTGTYWKSVLRGELSDQAMLEALPERLQVADGAGATLTALEARLALLRAEVGSDGAILAVADYGQIIDAPGEGTRDRVGAVWKALNDMGRRHRAVILVLSQMSRAASKAARGGERLGAEAVDGGAETAAIERWSTIVLEIGGVEAEDEDGRRGVSLSLAKGRMSGGDMVLPMLYEGKTGRWRVQGDARPAAEVRAEKADREAAGQRKADAEVLFEAVKAAHERGERLSRESWIKEHVLTKDRTKGALASLVEDQRITARLEYDVRCRRDVLVFLPAHVAPTAPKS